jgi:magnesium-transporting ATPase (P-type)
MTVIVEKDNRVFVYTKGADNIMLERIKNKESKCCKIVKENV